MKWVSNVSISKRRNFLIVEGSNHEGNKLANLSSLTLEILDHFFVDR